jgi:hypothetical protein
MVSPITGCGGGSGVDLMPHRREMPLGAEIHSVNYKAASQNLAFSEISSFGRGSIDTQIPPKQFLEDIGFA